MLDKFSAFMEKKIAPIANKVARNRYVMAIQNTFLTLIPFLTVGSFALILIEPAMDYTTMDPGFLRSFFKAWADFATFAGGPLNAIFTASMGCISLWVAIGIGYHLAKQYKFTTYMPVLLTTVTFLTVNGFTADGELTMDHFDGTGLFAAIVTSILAIEFYKYLYDRKVGRIDLQGQNVPPALTESFASLVPVAIVLLVMALMSSAVIAITGDVFANLIAVIMSPLVSMVDNVWGVLILSLLVMILWWFGIHDSVITGPLDPLLYNNLMANMGAYAAGTAAINLPYILTEPFWWTFMAIGGSGATFGLAILLLRSKSKQLRTVGKLGIVPAFFNINEPIIFGVPLMMNPVMFIPFVLAMTANGVITYILMDLQIVAKTFIYPSWNMFCPIAGLLSTMDIKGMLLVIFLIIMDTALYYPFFKIYEKQKLEEEAADAANQAIEAN